MSDFIIKKGAIIVVWKILFGLYSLLIGGLFTIAMILGDGTNITTGWQDDLWAVGATLLIFIVFGTLYSLAQKKKFITKNWVVAGTALFTAGVIHISYESFIEVMKEEAELMAPLSILGYIVVITLSLGVIVFILSPFLIPMVAYFLKEKLLSVIEKPFFRIYALCLLYLFHIPTIISQCYAIFIEKEFTPMYAILLFQASIYVAVALYSIAFAKKILTKKFWQITFLPQLFIVGFFPVKTEVSFIETIKENTGFANIAPILILFAIGLMALTTFMFYRYAFTDKLDEIKVIEEQ